MKPNSILRSLALCSAVAAALPLLAKPVNKTFNINQSAKIGRADLRAGEYRLIVDGSKATVQKDRQVVAEIEGRRPCTIPCSSAKTGRLKKYDSPARRACSCSMIS